MDSLGGSLFAGMELNPILLDNDDPEPPDAPPVSSPNSVDTPQVQSGTTPSPDVAASKASVEDVSSGKKAPSLQVPASPAVTASDSPVMGVSRRLSEPLDENLFGGLTVEPPLPDMSLPQIRTADLARPTTPNTSKTTGIATTHDANASTDSKRIALPSLASDNGDEVDDKTLLQAKVPLEQSGSGIAAGATPARPVTPVGMRSNAGQSGAMGSQSPLRPMAGGTIGTTPLIAAKPSGIRKKRRSVRVGYGRDAEEQESQGAMTGSPRLGAASRMPASPKGSSSGSPTKMGAPTLTQINGGAAPAPPSPAKRGGMEPLTPLQEKEGIGVSLPADAAAGLLSRMSRQLSQESFMSESKESVEEMEVVGNHPAVLPGGSGSLEEKSADVDMAVERRASLGEEKKAGEDEEGHRTSLPEVTTSLKQETLEVHSKDKDSGVAAEAEADDVAGVRDDRQEMGGDSTVSMAGTLKEEMKEEERVEEEVEEVGVAGELNWGTKLARLQRQFEAQKQVALDRRMKANAARKLALQARRQAGQKATAATAKLKELEAELGAACEREDFEAADALSGQLTEAEVAATTADRAAREAEAAADAAGARLQRVLDEEVQLELEEIRSLQAFEQEARDTARKISEDAATTAAAERERLSAAEEAIQAKKRKVGLEMRVLEEEAGDLQRQVEEATQPEIAERSELLEERNALDAELQELLAKVRAKEAEIAAQDEKIARVDERMAVASARFGRQQAALAKEEARVAEAATAVETELTQLANELAGIEAAVAEAEQRRGELEDAAGAAATEAAVLSAAAEARSATADKERQRRERREALAVRERQAAEDADALRTAVTAARTALQDMGVVRGKLQQEVGAAEQRVAIADKRGPEVEAEKKLAAGSRNYKEAGRLAQEAKALAADRDAAQAVISRLAGDLASVEAEEAAKGEEVRNLEARAAACERDVAAARCERLRLLALTARQQMDIAAANEDFEEAEALQTESEAAEAEADELQRAHALEGPLFERIVDESGAATSSSEAASKTPPDDASKDGDDAAQVSGEGVQGAGGGDEAVEGEGGEKDTPPQKESSATGEVREEQGGAEGAMDVESAGAECERLRQKAAAARKDMDEAAEAEDFERADEKMVESEAADAEADALQAKYGLVGRRFDKVENDENGDSVREDGEHQEGSLRESAEGKQPEEELSKEHSKERGGAEGEADDPTDGVREVVVKRGSEGSENGAVDSVDVKRDSQDLHKEESGVHQVNGTMSNGV